MTKHHLAQLRLILPQGFHNCRAVTGMPTVHNCSTQNSTILINTSYPPDNYHGSDVVYWSGGISHSYDKQLYCN